MQAVILAGGKGTRMAHLTKDRPKPLIEVSGKNLIEHKIDRMPKEIEEVIIVVGNMKEHIMDYFGNTYGGRKITYVDQGEQLGTAHALWKAKDVIKGDFISMLGDDIYATETISEVMKHPWAMTVVPHTSFATAGNVLIDSEGHLKDVIFDDEGISTEKILLDICLYRLQKNIFDAELVKVKNGKEFGLPHTVFKYVKENAIPMKIVRTEKWLKLNTPEEVAYAEQVFKQESPVIF